MRRVAALAVMAGALATTAFVPVPPLPDPDLPVDKACVYARPIDPDYRYCVKIDD